jgi:hypothetical protein
MTQAFVDCDDVCVVAGSLIRQLWFLLLSSYLSTPIKAPKSGYACFRVRPPHYHAKNCALKGPLYRFLQ